MKLKAEHIDKRVGHVGTIVKRIRDACKTRQKFYTMGIVDQEETESQDKHLKNMEFDAFVAYR